MLRRVVSSADQFAFSMHLGEDSDATGSVGVVTYGGKRYRQVCLVSAFRSVGVEVPYTCDGPFWVKHDGNEMLAPYGFEVNEVDQEAFGGEGCLRLNTKGRFVDAWSARGRGGCPTCGSALLVSCRNPQSISRNG